MPQEVVNLVIGVKGATEATQSLQTLDKLVSQLNNKKITLNVDTGSIQTFSKEVEKSVQLATQNINAQARLLKQKNQEISLNLQNQKELTKQAQLQAKVALEAQKTQQAIEKTAQAQANAQAQAQKTAQEQAKVAQQAEKTAQAEAKLATEAQKTATVEERRRLLAEQMSATYEKAALSAQGISSADSAGTEKVQAKANAVDDLANGYKRAAQNADMLSQIEKKVGKSTGETYSGELSTNGFQSYIRSLEGMQNATVAATRAVKAGGSTFQQFDVSVRKATGDYDNFTYSVDTGTKSMYKAENGMSAINKTAGKLSQSLGTMISKFAQWYIVGTLVSAPVRALSDALAELKKVDAELVNIQKVMGATSDEMERLSGKAFEVGSSLGIAASDYLASVTKWAQAGYGSLSDELGELSVKTQKVGDVQEETANQFLLSVDAAYKYKGNIQELTKVLDGANGISNNYATSVEKLAGGMGIVSSLAAQAGMKVEETMAAIGTITAVTQESGNSAARALRALILNIQGSTEIAIDEETGERWTEDEIQQMAAALGDLNIATREYKDGVEQLRNPMEVIGELSQKYRDGLVSEVQLQEVVSALGGKVRSNQLQALISNYEMYEEMIDTYQDSVGSADQELDIYLNSWEAKAKRLQNQWVEFIDSMKASEISKGLLDVGNALLTIANTDIGTTIIQVTALSAAITALAVAYSNYAKAKASADSAEAISGLGGLSKAVGAVKEFGASFGTAIKGAASAVSGASGLVGKFTAGLSALTETAGGTFLAVGGVIAAITALVKVIDFLTVTTQEHLENAQKAREEYEETTSSINEMTSAMETNLQKIEELNSAGPLSLTDQSDLERLKAENALLETQIDLAKQKQQISANEAFKESSAALDGIVTVMGNPNGMDQIELLKYYMETIKEMEKTLTESGVTPEDNDQFQSYQEKYIDLAEQIITTYEDATLAAEYGSAAASEWLEENQGVINSIQMFGNEAGWAVDKINELAESSTAFADSLSAIQADGAVTVAEVQGLLQRFPELRQILDESGFSAEEFAEHLNAATKKEKGLGNAAGNTSDELENQEEDLETLSEKLDEFSNKFSSIENAQEELKESGALSLSTISGLIEKFPELESALTEYLAGLSDEADLQQVLTEAYDSNAKEYKDTILQKMGSSEDFYNSVVLGNEETVAKLKALGIEDLENYKTIEDLKKSAHSEAENEQTKKTAEETKKRILLYQQQLKAMANSIAAVGGTDTGAGDGVVSTVLGGVINAAQSGLDKQLQEAQNAIDSIGPSLEEINKILYSSISIPNISGSSGSGGSSSSGSSSTQSWYETQISALQELVNSVKDTNTLLEKEDKNSAEKRVKNLEDMQGKISAMADAFRAKGLSNSSDEVKQLKLMWHDLADEIEAVYQSMYDDLMEGISDDEWQLDLFQKNREQADRSVEEIAADNAKIVASYQQMQKEIAELGAYYRSMGYDETDDLIQDLSDAWWDYQEKIESVYDSLTEAFENYISESDRQIKDLERTTGTAGQQIELYTKRIQEAQKAIAELQKTNANGINDDRIGSIKDQIYSDEDAIKNIQDSLWDELENAIDREFDKKQDEIDDAQKEVDRINDILDKYDDELAEAIKPFEEAIEQAEKDLEDALEPIEDRLDDLNDRLEEEQKALEALTDPLNKQIEGYYEVNPDGSLGVYVPGLNDQIEDLQDQLDAENEKWEEQQEREEEALQLQKKELALQEAIKNLEQAQLDLETSRNERTVYTLKDGVWAWRADESAIKEAEDALEDAEQAKEDAENDLEDFKEEQAHKEIVKLLESQIEALEKQKEYIETQIEIYEKESQARQEYLQDLIDQAEDEKEAKEDYYNKIIEQNQKEIDARQEYYDNLKAQYNEELESWETRVEELQAQYDEWAEQWEDIQDAMTGDVRSIEEILADIANYGTPAMKEQIDRVTDLLEQMGVAIGDFNSSIGNDNTSGGGSLSAEDIINQMKANSELWKQAQSAGDTDEMERLQDANKNLAAQLDPSIGAWLDSNGVWRDKNGNRLYDMSWINGGSSETETSEGTSWPSAGGSSSGGSSGTVTANPDVKQTLDGIRFDAMYKSEAEKQRLFAQANSLAVKNGAQPIQYTPIVNDWRWYDANGNYLYDQGGIASGKGVMLKGVENPEVVLSPVLAADVLNPIRNQEFIQFADALGIMFSTAHDFAPDLRPTPATVSTNNTDSHNVYINGVQIGESMVQRPLSETLSLLGIHRNM